MTFTRQINYLIAGSLVLLIVIGGAASYWAITGPEGILTREDNPRRVEAEAAIRRGSIYDATGVLLAETRVTDTGALERHYSYPAMNSALGYFSLRYGTGGAEAAYNDILRGETLPLTWERHWEQNVLHRPGVGSDVQLTLRHEIQQAAAGALQGQRGAAVVLRVPDGAILALVSQPTFDPNTLDTNWADLIAAEDTPFFNRALQSRYQPGGTIQTLLLALATLTNTDINAVYMDADRVLEVDDLSVGCTEQPPQSELTLRQAYAYGCPAPFLELAEALGATRLNQFFSGIYLDQLPIMAGFVPEVRQNGAALPFTDPIQQAADVIGQSQFTLNPLTLAGMAAAIAGNGNVPAPYALAATRPPGGDWHTFTPDQASTPLLTNEAARRLREIMTTSLPEGAARAASRPDLSIGGQAALAYTGEETLAWFMGFAPITDDQALAIALVIEQSSEPARAARLAGDILEVGVDVLAPE